LVFVNGVFVVVFDFVVVVVLVRVCGCIEFVIGNDVVIIVFILLFSEWLVVEVWLLVRLKE